MVSTRGMCSVNLFYCVSPYYGIIGVLVMYGPHRERRSQEAGRPYNFLDALLASLELGPVRRSVIASLFETLKIIVKTF